MKVLNDIKLSTIGQVTLFHILNPTKAKFVQTPIPSLRNFIITKVKIEKNAQFSFKRQLLKLQQ